MTANFSDITKATGKAMISLKCQKKCFNTKSRKIFFFLNNEEEILLQLKAEDCSHSYKKC